MRGCVTALMLQFVPCVHQRTLLFFLTHTPTMAKLRADGVQQYLNEISVYPLLTASQEIELARTIAEARLLEDKQDLTLAEKRLLKRGHKAKQTLVTSNLRLVVYIAKQYGTRLSGTNMELMDLIQEGTLGLARASELFDHTRGYKFSTYAYWWIKQGITRGIDMKERLIRIPQHSVDKVYKIERYKRTFMTEHGRAPTIEELAEHVHSRYDDVLLMLTRSARHCSLDSCVAEGDGTMIDFVLDENAVDAQHDFEIQVENKATLQLALACLSEEETHLIKKRYGLDGNPPAALSVLAKECGMTRERLRHKMQVLHSKMRVNAYKARLVSRCDKF